MDVREKLVEQLRWWSVECDRTNFGCQARKLLVEAADYIAHGGTVQEWVSVKDRLPENDQRVLCFNYNGEYRVLRWNYIDWMWNSGIEWLKEDYVLYWMPLPQPPKGE